MTGRSSRLRVTAVAAVAAAGLFLSAAAPVCLAAPPTAATPAKTPCDLLVTAGWVLTMDPSFRIVPAGAVAVKDGVIVAVGAAADLDARYEPKERVDRRSSAVLPGLVNTHTHAAMNLLRGIANDKPLMEWLQKTIFPAEALNVSPEFVKAGTELACLEMLRSGTTTFADMYYFESDVAAAVDRAGMRAVLGETWLDFPVPDHKDLEAEKRVTRAFLERWKGHPRVTAAVAPHAPYTCSKETLLAAKALADEFGAPMLIHLSETRAEQQQIREKYGTTPTRWLDSIGFLGPRLCAAHGVWLDEGDLRILAERKVSLAHNPESNMILGSGIAPVVAARKAGVVVGLGTDGVAGSNNDLEMTEAMDFAAKLAKVKDLDPTAIAAKDLLRMATIDGARALGLGATVGSLETGKRADLIAIDLSRPGVRPVYDVPSTLVYAAKGGDVSLTVVDGKVLFDGQRVRTLDEPAILKAADAWRDKIAISLAPRVDVAPAPVPAGGAR